MTGVQFTVEDWNHRAIFNDTGTKTYEGGTTGGPRHLNWAETANEMTILSIRYNHPRGAINNAPGQKVVASIDSDLADANIQFEVRRDFQPTATTEMSSNEVQRGQKVISP